MIDFLLKAKQFATMLNLQFPPVIQAPMAGGVTTPELVAAVSNAGGLGSFATGYLKADDVIASIKAIQSLTTHAFAANLFVPPQHMTIDRKLIQAYQARLNIFRAELGLDLEDETVLPTLPTDHFPQIVEALLETSIQVISFTFGILDKKIRDAFKARGVFLIGTATTLEEALQLEASGIDAVVAQGYEAGGHRGGFSSPLQQAQIGTFALIPQIADKVKIPVIAAGGIMDARGVIAAISLGASAVQMGTAFLGVKESGANAVYKAQLAKAKHATHDVTAVTSAYSGSPARGIETRFMREMAGEPTPDYPIPHYLTQAIRREAAKQNCPDLMSMWCGQGIGIDTGCETAAQLLEKIRSGMRT